LFSQGSARQAPWQAIDLTEMAMGAHSFVSKIMEDPVSNLLMPLGQLLFILVLTFIALRLLGKMVDHLFSLSHMQNNKAHTLRKLIKSVLHYALYFISILTILTNLGFDPMPVLAGAGIFGLAIGFGAQNLVRDVITGFFLIFEGQLEVGDVVQINGQIQGTVEEVGLRVTKIREFNQRLHYLANGNITQVTNYNREKMRAIVTVTVPYEANFDQVNQALAEVCDQIAQKYSDSLIEQPEVMEVTQMDQTGVQFTITALSQPKAYYALEREIRKEAILTLYRYGISVAYPKSVIYHLTQNGETQTKEGTHP
jgi:moderate conductance mechanosensitive channel